MGETNQKLINSLKLTQNATCTRKSRRNLLHGPRDRHALQVSKPEVFQVEPEVMLYI